MSPSAGFRVVKLSCDDENRAHYGENDSDGSEEEIMMTPSNQRLTPVRTAPGDYSHRY